MGWNFVGENSAATKINTYPQWDIGGRCYLRSDQKSLRVL